MKILNPGWTLPAALLLSTPALFATPQRGGGDDAWKAMLEKYDADGDGVISRKEYTRDEAHWKNLDVDGDGQVQREEFMKRGWYTDGRPKRPDPPKVGTVAPDFKLDLLPPPPKPGAKPKAPQAGDKKAKPKQVRLSSFKGKRPVALIFGSYT